MGRGVGITKNVQHVSQRHSVLAAASSLLSRQPTKAWKAKFPLHVINSSSPVKGEERHTGSPSCSEADTKGKTEEEQRKSSVPHFYGPRCREISPTPLA